MILFSIKVIEIFFQFLIATNRIPASSVGSLGLEWPSLDDLTKVSSCISESLLKQHSDKKGDMSIQKKMCVS